jgi:hypothetical protein
MVSEKRSRTGSSISHFPTSTTTERWAGIVKETHNEPPLLQIQMKDYSGEYPLWRVVVVSFPRRKSNLIHVGFPPRLERRWCCFSPNINQTSKPRCCLKERSGEGCNSRYWRSGRLLRHVETTSGWVFLGTKTNRRWFCPRTWPYPRLTSSFPATWAVPLVQVQSSVTIPCATAMSINVLQTLVRHVVTWKDKFFFRFLRVTWLNKNNRKPNPCGIYWKTLSHMWVTMSQ